MCSINFLRVALWVLTVLLPNVDQAGEDNELWVLMWNKKVD